MNYKSHIRLGFTTLEREVVKVPVNSRVMVDPQNFRRVNPNYPVSDVQFADFDLPVKPRRVENENAGPLELQVDDNCSRTQKEPLHKPHGQRGEVEREFTEEELLISSPIVLGFVFSEKLWLKLTISGIQEIE